MNRRDTDLLAHMNRRLRAADRSNTMNKLETLIAAVSAQIRADFDGVNLDDFDRLEVTINGVERKPKAEPEPIKIDHPWTEWVAGDVDKYPVPGETKIIGRLRAGITVEGLAKDFCWRELGGSGTIVAYKILEAAPEQKPEPADGEPKFIEWNGGENPAPGRLVEYKLRNGSVYVQSSENLDWSYDGVDIVGYRVVGDDPDAEAPEDELEELHGAEALRIDAMTAEEVNILNGLRRMRRHGIAHIETLQGPIDTSEGLIFPDQQLVENAKVQLGESFDNLILAVAR